MIALRKVSGNKNIIMLLGIAAGLLWGEGAAWVEPLVLPVLAVVMTISITGIGQHDLRPLKATITPACIGVFMNYVVLSSVILLLSRYFVSDHDLLIGFILIAAVPPAVAIIPFTYLLKGDHRLSLIGTLGGYAAALVVLPVIVTVFLGSQFPALNTLFIIVIVLVLLPLVASRLLNRTGFNSRLEPYKGTITNWSFSLVTYVIVGLNREIFLYRPASLIGTALIVLATTFLLGWIVETVMGKLAKVSPAELVSLVLMGTLKNYGVAGGLALMLFSKESSTPSTVASVVMIVYVIWLDWRLNRGRSSFSAS